MTTEQQKRLQVDEAIASTSLALRNVKHLSYNERGTLFFLILKRIEERDGTNHHSYPWIDA